MARKSIKREVSTPITNGMSNNDVVEIKSLLRYPPHGDSDTTVDPDILMADKLSGEVNDLNGINGMFQRAKTLPFSQKIKPLLIIANAPKKFKVESMNPVPQQRLRNRWMPHPFCLIMAWIFYVKASKNSSKLFKSCAIWELKILVYHCLK